MYPAIVEQINGYREWADPLLIKKFERPDISAKEKLHIALALLPADVGKRHYVRDQLFTVRPDHFSVLLSELEPYKDELAADMWGIALDADATADSRFRSAAVLAAFWPDDRRWSDIAPFVARHLTGKLSSSDFAHWLRHFEIVAPSLAATLVAVHNDRTLAAAQLQAAAETIAIYCVNDPKCLAKAILAADTRAEFAPLASALIPHGLQVKDLLLSDLEATTPDVLSIKDQHQRRSWSAAAVALVQLGYGDEVWPLLKFTPDPTLRNYLIWRFGLLSTGHTRIFERLQVESDDSIRAALIQILGSLNSTSLSAQERDRISAYVGDLYAHDVESGIHSSAAWMLAKWGMPLPELSGDEHARLKQHAKRVEEASTRANELQRQIDTYIEEQVPAQQAEWETSLRDQQSTGSEFLEDRLIAHYAFDESEGLDAKNSIAETATASYAGSTKPEWVPGIVGGAVRLDSHGHFDCASEIQLTRMDEISVSCWFLMDIGSQRGAIVGSHDVAKRQGFAINVEPTSGQVIVELSHHYPENALVVRGQATKVTGRWHHLLVTYDGSSRAAGVNICVDGEPIRTWTEADRLSNSIQADVPFHIGMRHSDHPFQGVLDDLRIWKRCLPVADAVGLFDQGLKALCECSKELRTPEQQSLLQRSWLAHDDSLRELIHMRDSASREIASQRTWYVNSQDQTMIVFPATTGENAISHSFAIGSTEVTVREFASFSKGYEHEILPSVAPTDSCPAHRISWYMAAKYCNWLSEQEGIPKDQWVYEPSPDSGLYDRGMKIKDNYWQLRGYRLPTQSEWKYACRAGAWSQFGFGETIELMPGYGRTILTGSAQSHPVGTLLPNSAGVFDMHGNLFEWTQQARYGPPSPVDDDNERLLMGGAFASLPEHAQSNNSKGFDIPSISHVFYGFRVARSLPESDRVPSGPAGGEVDRP